MKLNPLSSKPLTSVNFSQINILSYKKDSQATHAESEILINIGHFTCI